MNDPDLSRRDQLLVDGALGCLGTQDATALAELLREPTAAIEFAALERAAAMVTVVHCIDEIEAVPIRRSLEVRLRDDAFAFFAESPRPPQQRTAEPSRPASMTRSTPWLLAAAAMFLVWLSLRSDPLPPPPEQARAELLAATTPLVRCDWTPGPSPRRGQISGDVVWDPEQQQGFLRLRGLPELPAGQRFQLWIVDGSRQGPPVDGGLLTPGETRAEIVVQVTARIPVRQAAAFVLTIEQAEGVVVSAQEHVVAVARP